jgi:hypothetical protein
MLLLESDRKFCDKFRGKGKVVPAPAMKAYRGSAGIPPVIFNLDTRNYIEVSGGFMSKPFCAIGRMPLVPIE